MSNINEQTFTHPVNSFVNPLVTGTVEDTLDNVIGMTALLEEILLSAADIQDLSVKAHNGLSLCLRSIREAAEAAKGEPSLASMKKH